MSHSEQQFAIVVSRFNTEVTEKLLQGALARCQELRIPERNIQVFHVPGAVEIPLVAKRLAKAEKYHAIICLGAVIQGETDHYDYVCQQVSYGCQKVMLKFEIPVIFGVLTTQTVEQAFDRVGGRHGHKGKDAIDTAVAMAQLMKSL